MRIITKVMLACSVVGSVSLTSCKDYSEEEYIEVRVETQDQLKAMQQQISDLVARIEASKCGCDGVSIVNNGDGTVTIKDKNGNQVTVSEQMVNNPGTDANGSYVTDAAGNKIYIPSIVKNPDGSVTINNGSQTFVIPAASGDADHEVTIAGDKITIKKGTDTWEFDKSTLAAACDCDITYNEAEKSYTIKAGGKTQTIKPGTVSTYTDNGDGTVTFDNGNGSTLSLRKVKSDVWAEKNEAGLDVICIQKYNEDGTKNGEVEKITIPAAATPVDLTEIENNIKNILTELYGENGTAAAPKEGSVVDRLNKQEDLTKVIYGEGGNAENPTAESIFGRLNKIDSQITDILGRLGKLEDARAKQVTGIIVQQVVNPAFGSYNSILTNVQSNMLIAYYGQAAGSVTFPTNDDASIAKVNLRSGDLIMKGNGNAGYMYVTINPNTVDFNGMQNCLSLVNSQDDACAVSLGAVQKSDDILTFGLTRAANNGFYQVPATITPAGLADPRAHIAIDKTAIKEALKAVVNTKSKSDAKIALKEIAEAGLKTAAALNNIEAQGVKCSWTDQYGEHAVYSNYNIAAIAASPLGFYSVDGVFADGGKYWKAYSSFKGLIEKGSKKIGKKLSDQINKQFMLDKLHGDIADIQAKFNHIEYIKKLDGQIIMNTNVTVGPFTNIAVGPFTTTVNVEIPAQSFGTGDYTTTVTVPVEVPEAYDPATGTFTTKTENKEVEVTIPNKEITVPGQKIPVEVTIPVQHVTIPAQTVNINVDITDQVNGLVNGMIDDVNSGFKDVNDLIDTLNVALNDVNLMLKNIDNLQNKLENGSYISGVYQYLDKIAAKVAQYTPELFKPALLVNSDNGFGICGFRGAPSYVSGNVTLVPTTWTAELLTPIYKKYIRVNGGNGQYVEGESIDITSQLHSGVNTVEYRALDYNGKEWQGVYQIIR